MLWVVVSFVLGFLASMAGGYVAAAISANPRVPLFLAALVFVLSIAAAVPELTSKGAVTPRTGTVSNMTAMQSARNPVWFALLIPFTGAAAVLAGARMRRRNAPITGADANRVV